MPAAARPPTTAALVAARCRNQAWRTTNWRVLASAERKTAARYAQAGPEMRPGAHAFPAVDVYGNEDRFEKEEDAFDSETDAVGRAVGPHEAGPQQPELEGQLSRTRPPPRTARQPLSTSAARAPS